MIQELDNILKQVREHKMTTFDARVKIFGLKDDYYDDEKKWTKDEVILLIEDFVMTTHHIPINDPKRKEVCKNWLETKLK
jgi:hypothetical protein